MTTYEILQRDSKFRDCLLESRLWAGDEKKQIEIMIELYNCFPETEKPVWLTMDQSKMVISEQ